MKTIIKLLFSFAFILLIIGCPKDDSTDVVTKPNLTVYTNPTDPLLLKAETSDGNTICYYGKKDRETGIAESLDAYSVLEFGETEETFVQLDDYGRTEQIYTPSGVVFNIEWVTDDEIRIEAISPDGDIQISIPFDLSDDPFKNSEPNQQTSFNSIRTEKETLISVLPLVEDVHQQKDIEGTQGNVSFNLQQCGYQVLNASITIRFNPNTVLNGQYGIMENMGNGQYNINTPVAFNYPNVDLKPLCSKLLNLLNVACAGQSGLSLMDKAAICGKISAEATAVFPNAVAAGVIAAACGTAFTASQIYCSFIHEDAGGGTSIDSWFCGELTEVFNNPPIEYQMKAYIKVPGVASVPTDWLPYSSNSSNSYTVTIPPKLRIANFKTEPADPKPNEGYTSSAIILCPSTEGTEVKISIVGTDGYTNSKTETIDVNSTIILYVPGAEAGVRDVITINCKDGPKKEISIVF